MKTFAFFNSFLAEVKKTSEWKSMENTVEASQWHREANVAVHTEMCIAEYMKLCKVSERSERQKLLTLVALTFHDLGKPEAEETIDHGDGTAHRRYAGHEGLSANFFIDFMMKYPALRKMFFDAGGSEMDLRRIKFIIERHLPYGLKNATKRAELRRTLIDTLGDCEVSFYDHLMCDTRGQISDDMDTKIENAQRWVDEFQFVQPSKPLVKKSEKTMIVLVGPVGAGKSTWTQHFKSMNPNKKIIVVSEDRYRVEFYFLNLTNAERVEYMKSPTKEQYAKAWEYCFQHSADYDRYAQGELMSAVEKAEVVVLDRTNQTRKSRSKWISAARSKGFQISSVEFYLTEKLSLDRQSSRPDKSVPKDRVHQIYKAFDVPMLGVEVDEASVVMME